MSTLDGEAITRREKTTPHKIDCYDVACVHWSRGDRAFRIYHTCGLAEKSSSLYSMALKQLTKHMDSCGNGEEVIDATPAQGTS